MRRVQFNYKFWKSFRLKNNLNLITREGKPARVICDDLLVPDQSHIAVAVTRSLDDGFGVNFTCELLWTYGEDGRYYKYGGSSIFDLFMEVPTDLEPFVPIFLEDLHE